MLQLSAHIDDDEAYEIVRKFVNDRLIGLMEDIILDEVSWNMAERGELDESSYNKSFNEMVDLAELLTDRDFAENVSSAYLPEWFPIERANQEFFSLYKLLKAKKEYIPELVMEYALYHVIYSNVGDVDMINEDTEEGLFDEMMGDPFFEGIEDEEYTTVMQIPEPDREKVLKAIRKQCEDECSPEEVDEAVEYTISLYEDLRHYDEICFWDMDYALLDEMDEEELQSSSLNQYMGISDTKEPNIIQFPMKGKDGRDVNVSVKLDIHPWDMEDEET